MRNDAIPRIEANPEGDLDASQPAMRPVAGSKVVAWCKIPALLILMAGTCWVVADLISAWLVPPYLVVMALILFPSAKSTRQPGGSKPTQRRPTAKNPSNAHHRDRRTGDLAGWSKGGGDPVDVGSAPESSSLDPDGLTDPGTLAADSGGEGGLGAVAVKPKRARSRARKGNKPIAEPVEVVEATWIEVGPGKFVRAESPAQSAPVAGPHASLEPAPAFVSVDDPAHSAPEIHESAEEPAGPFAGPEPVVTSRPVIEPTLESAAIDSDPEIDTVDDPVEPLALEVSQWVAEGVPTWPVPLDPEVASSGDFHPDAPTFDGIALQVGRDVDRGPGWESLSVAEETGFRPDPDVELLDPSTETVEPHGDTDPDRAQVTSDEIEPTSNKTQDVVLPNLDVDLVDHSVFSTVPARRTIRQVRVGLHRVNDRSGSQGRSGRPLRSPRNPTTRRRLSRRPGGRPRQIARTFPPRSPPRSRSNW